MEIKRGILKEILKQIHNHYCFPSINKENMLKTGILVSSKIIDKYEIKLFLKCDTLSRLIYAYGESIEFFFNLEIYFNNQLIIKSDVLDSLVLTDTLKGKEFINKFNSLIPRLNQSIAFKTLFKITGITKIPNIELSKKKPLKPEECFHHWYILLDEKGGVHYKIFPEYEKYYLNYSEKDKFNLSQIILDKCPNTYKFPLIYDY